MKEKLISRLIIGALAGVAAMGAQAGQIQSSSVSIAREVIVENTQPVTAPATSYRFAGDINAISQTQTFQVQLTLQGGAKWNDAALPTANAFQIRDGIANTLWTQNATVGNETYQIPTGGIGLSTDKTTLFVTFVVDQSNTKTLLKQPLITFNAATGTTRGTIVNLKTVVESIGECNVDVKKLVVKFSHFNGLSSPTALATTANASEDESARTDATNSGTLITFPTNILVKVGASLGDAKVDVANGATVFKGTVNTPTATSSSFVTTKLVNLGYVGFTQNALGYDTDLVNPYLLTAAGANNIIDGVTNVGVVNAKKLVVDVTADQGFTLGSEVYLSGTASCAAALAGTGKVTVTSANVGKISLEDTLAGIIAAADATGSLVYDADGRITKGGVFVCYDVTNATAQIANSTFSAAAKLVKSSALAADNGEQDNYCKGNLYGLGGSVKIDVRNYFNSKDSTWASQIRLINPDESRTVDVYGQLIQKDGKYGPYGKLATLAPREAKNMLATEIDAKLITAATHATANGDATVQASEGHGARLRITSPNAQTLRVQNYLYNKNDPSKFLEASGSQAVDFAGSADRAPTGEGQFQSQDAWVGLNGNN